MLALSDYFDEYELELMPLVAAGLSNAEMGARIYRSEETIKTWMQRASRKITDLLEPGISPQRTRTAAFYAWFIERPDERKVTVEEIDISDLTVVQRAIVTYFPYGQRRQEIAHARIRSDLTIKTHMRRIVDKLKKDRTLMAYLVARQGICGRPLPSDWILQEQLRKLKQEMKISELLLTNEGRAMAVEECGLGAPHALPLVLYRCAGPAYLERYRRRTAKAVADFRERFQPRPWVPLLIRGWTPKQLAYRLEYDGMTMHSEVLEATWRYGLEDLTELALLAMAAE